MSRTSDRTYQRKRTRLKASAQLTGGLTCVLCLEPIDLSLQFPDPMSFSSDHIDAVARGGDNRGELEPMHLDCNRRKGVRPLADVQVDRHSRQHY